MTDKRRCSGLSKGWWWLLALIGLALLYYFMLSAKWDPIEKDIQTRTVEKLISNGSEQVTVEIKKRGRDVLLNGTASTEAEREQAIKTAQAVRGVRIVEDNIKVIPLLPPEFLLSSNVEHKVTLSGTMPSQASIDTLLNATVATYGIDNVENKLSIGKHIASPSWISDLKPLVSDLKSIKNAGLALSADSQKISGVVRTEEQKTKVLSKFTSIFGDKAIDALIVQPLQKPSLQVKYGDGKVVIEGMLGSQVKIDELINKVADKVGKDKVVNKLTLNDDYSNTNGVINLLGEATSKGSYNLVISAVEQGGEALGLKFDNELTLNDLEAIAVAKAEAERIAEEKAAAEKAEAERIAQEEKAAAEKAEAERIAEEKAAAEKAEAERIAEEKAAAEKAEAERIAQEKAAAEKAEAERIAEEKAAADKAEADRIAEEKAAAEKAEAERIAQEKAAAEADRIAEEKAAAEKAEAERIAEEKVAAEKAEAERMAAQVAFAKKIAEQKATAKREVKACQTRLNQIMTGKTILFRTNKANIKRASFSLLNNIVVAIKGCKGKVENTTIEVSGHTDSVGSDAYNLQLSQRRANAVRTYLARKGVDQTMITSKGYGETQPVASNANAKGRSQNRRITFSVR